MAKQKVTSFDVAKRAGVSRATVSMVLNQSTAVTISDETRARVLKAALELRYTPNSAARMLVRGSTDTIGLMVSDPDILKVDGFVPQLLYGISRAVQRQRYRVLLEAVHATEDPNAYLELVQGRRIDGLIVLNPQTDASQLYALIDSHFPLVLLGSLRHPQEYSVNFSTRAAIQQAIAHLVALGHRRIAHITFSPAGSVATDARLGAYGKALVHAGIAPDAALIANGAFSAESGYSAMTDLLRQRPTAVLAGNDTIALGAMAAIHDAGLRIPNDMAIIGFDDLPFAPYTRPPLTTIRNPAVHQGEIAAQMLIKLLHDEEPLERQVTVDTELIVRGSCGARR